MSLDHDHVPRVSFFGRAQDSEGIPISGGYFRNRATEMGYTVTKRDVAHIIAYADEPGGDARAELAKVYPHAALMTYVNFEAWLDKGEMTGDLFSDGLKAGRTAREIVFGFSPQDVNNPAYGLF